MKYNEKKGSNKKDGQESKGVRQYEHEWQSKKCDKLIPILRTDKVIHRGSSPLEKLVAPPLAAWTHMYIWDCVKLSVFAVLQGGHKDKA